MIAPDTSVVVPALGIRHHGHEQARRALAGREAVLVASVGIETISVLSRMPEGHRIAASVVLEALTARFPSDWVALDAGDVRVAIGRAVTFGITGGALYDAIIGATALVHGAIMLSADKRAQRAYRAMGVEAEIVELEP